MSLDLIKRAERRELQALRKAARKQRRRDWWARWTAWWDGAGRSLKVAAQVIGTVTAIVSAVTGLAKAVPPLVAGVRRAWGMYAAIAHARDAPPVLPPPSDLATTALDFITKHPPDGGQPR